MSIGNINSALAVYQYANKTQKSAVGKTGFMEQLNNTAKAGEARVDEYLDYLKSKYGNVSIQSIGKDQASLDRVGRSMSGNDVIIAPNILEQMANDQEKAAYYEKKIDDYFDAIPRLNAQFAAQGLVHEPGGVVIHEDGSVTYIGGCSDSPERIAKVKAEQKAKREKRAEQQKEQMERSREAAEQRKRIMESHLQKQAMMEAIHKSMFDPGVNYYFAGQSQMALFAMPSYTSAISTFSTSIMDNM